MSSAPQITVIVRLYSILRERDGQIVDRLELDLPAGSQVADLLQLLEIPSELELVLALDGRIVEETAVLTDQCQLAIIPAIAGGTLCL